MFILYSLVGKSLIGRLVIYNIRVHINAFNTWVICYLFNSIGNAHCKFCKKEINSLITLLAYKCNRTMIQHNIIKLDFEHVQELMLFSLFIL